MKTFEQKFNEFVKISQKSDSLLRYWARSTIASSKKSESNLIEINSVYPFEYSEENLKWDLIKVADCKKIYQLVEDNLTLALTSSDLRARILAEEITKQKY